MKKIIYFLLPLLFCTCEENNTSNTGPAKPGELLILNDSSKANATNELQAVYTSANKSINSYFYGSFTPDGKPNNITQMIINKNMGDTAINVFFDSNMRVKTVYISSFGSKFNSMLAFDYSVSGKVIVNAYHYDFTKDSSRLKHQIVLNDLGDGTFSLDNHTPYKAVQGLPFDIDKNSLSRRNGDFISKYTLAVGGIVILNAVIMTSTTAIGCMMGGFPGCVLGGIVGNYLVTGPQKANASEIGKLPLNTPKSPSSDILGNNDISLMFNDISFLSINTCDLGNSYFGSNNRVRFYVFDKNNVLDQTNWLLYEKVGGQGEVAFKPIKQGNIVYFDGCLYFGGTPVIPANYYIKTSNGVSTNVVRLNYCRPPGAN